jgi:membrane-bound lytic murein transglycosylase D
MWQFMPETARELGMRIDWWVDERRDPVRATDGAVKMLRWLRGQFGSLFVAAAAYNGGPGRVSRGVALVAASEAADAAGGTVDSAAAAVLAALDGAERGDRSAAPLAGDAPNAPPSPAVGEARFFALADAGVIAAETRNYVPQLIAAALVGKEAARHGIAVRREAPLAYDEVRVPALTPLAAVAAASRSGRAELLDLNPHLLRGMTPPGGSYVVRVPDGRGDGAAARLAALDPEDRRAFRRLVTRKREAFESLADRAGVGGGLLRAYNPGLATVERGRYRGRLVSNQAVRVPTAAVLAYARAVHTVGAPGALPALPAPPPEPKPAARTKRGATAAARGTSDETSRDGTAKGADARDADAKGADTKDVDAKGTEAKGANAKDGDANGAEARSATARRPAAARDADAEPGRSAVGGAARGESKRGAASAGAAKAGSAKAGSAKAGSARASNAKAGSAKTPSAKGGGAKAGGQKRTAESGADDRASRVRGGRSAGPARGGERPTTAGSRRARAPEPVGGAPGAPPTGSGVRRCRVAGRSGGAGSAASQWPERPPRFSTTRTPTSSVARSTPLTMSYTVSMATVAAVSASISTPCPPPCAPWRARAPRAARRRARAPRRRGPAAPGGRGG